MKAHTPGPWTADETTIRDGEGRKLAAVGFGKHDGAISAQLSDDEAAANRRAMAAAPELLDMLWQFIEYMESCVDYGVPHSDESNNDHENMREALALWEKATGTAHQCQCRHCRAERAAPPPPPCPVAEINRGGIGPGITAERRCSLPEGHEGDHAYGSWVRV